MREAAIRDAQLPTTLNTEQVHEVPDYLLRGAKLVNGQLVNWGGDPYEGDVLPKDMPKEKRPHFLKRYKVLREEYYSKNKRHVVTPDNVQLFLSVHRRWAALNNEKLHWDFTEQWSCSGRLSSHAYRRGLAVGFPVDYRYGWDLNKRSIDDFWTTFT